MPQSCLAVASGDFHRSIRVRHPRRRACGWDPCVGAPRAGLQQALHPRRGVCGGGGGSFACGWLRGGAALRTDRVDAVSQVPLSAIVAVAFRGIHGGSHSIPLLIPPSLPPSLLGLNVFSPPSIGSPLPSLITRSLPSSRTLSLSLGLLSPSPITLPLPCSPSPRRHLASPSPRHTASYSILFVKLSFSELLLSTPFLSSRSSPAYQHLSNPILTPLSPSAVTGNG